MISIADCYIRTKKIKYLEENAAAIDVKLTPEDVKKIRAASDAVDAFSGDRYPTPG